MLALGWTAYVVAYMHWTAYVTAYMHRCVIGIVHAFYVFISLILGKFLLVSKW